MSISRRTHSQNWKSCITANTLVSGLLLRRPLSTVMNSKLSHMSLPMQGMHPTLRHGTGLPPSTLPIPPILPRGSESWTLAMTPALENCRGHTHILTMRDQPVSISPISPRIPMRDTWPLSPSAKRQLLHL